MATSDNPLERGVNAALKAIRKAGASMTIQLSDRSLPVSGVASTRTVSRLVQDAGYIREETLSLIVDAADMHGQMPQEGKTAATDTRGDGTTYTVVTVVDLQHSIELHLVKQNRYPYGQN